MDQIKIGKFIAQQRKEQNLTQRELGEKLGVSYKAVSKWETGLSVPDSDMLIAISEALEIPVSALLGETITESKAEDLKVISQKLEIINLQFAKRKRTRQKLLHWLMISLCAVTVMISAALIVLNSPYLNWDYSDPETAVLGVAFHSFEWIFVRLAPIVFIGSVVGIFMTREKEFIFPE